MKRIQHVLSAGLAVVCLSAGLVAQTAQTTSRPGVQTKVDVVVSRYQGDKKTSSLPFTLWVNIPGPKTVGNSAAAAPWGSASLRMGVDVPVGTKASTQAHTSGQTTTTDQTNSAQYRNVGTSIDCQLSQLEDGKYNVSVSVQDSSIYTQATATAGRGVPRLNDPLAFRTFSLNNALPMTDGQTLEYATAADKISGELVKVHVTLTVVK